MARKDVMHVHERISFNTVGKIDNEAVSLLFDDTLSSVICKDP